MKENPNIEKPKPGDCVDTSCQVWLVSKEEKLKKRINEILQSKMCQVIEIDSHLKDTECNWLESVHDNGFIVLDIDSDVDWGVSVIEQIKRRRILAPIIVMTEVFSRDFGEQILSQGVRYYFPHDFSALEFEEVMQNLTKSCGGSKPV